MKIPARDVEAGRTFRAGPATGMPRLKGRRRRRPAGRGTDRSWPSDLTPAETRAVREAQGAARRTHPRAVPGLTRRISERGKSGAMRLDKFTVKAQEVLAGGAVEGPTSTIIRPSSPKHLLAALLEQREGVVGSGAGPKLGARPDAIQRELEAALDTLPAVKGGSGQYLGDSYAAKRSSALKKEAERLKDELRLDRAPAVGARPGPRRSRRPHPWPEPASTPKRSTRRLVEIRGNQAGDGPEPRREVPRRSSATPRDLTELRRAAAKLGPGSSAATKRIRRVNSRCSRRRTKNNPVLIRRARRRQDSHRRGTPPSGSSPGDVPERLEGQDAGGARHRLAGGPASKIPG